MQFFNDDVVDFYSTTAEKFDGDDESMFVLVPADYFMKPDVIK